IAGRCCRRVRPRGGLQWRFKPSWMLSGSLGVLYGPRQSALMPAQLSQVQVEVGTTLVTGVVSPCVHGRIAFPWVFGCIGLELGGRHIDGPDLPHATSAFTLWAALDPRLGIELPLGSQPRPHVPQFALRVFGDMPVLLHRPRALVGEGSSMSDGRITPVLTTPLVAGAFHL